MNIIDKAMKKYGYTNMEETKYGVFYIKQEPQKYDHVVCVLRKASGRHILQSYDAELVSVPGRLFVSPCAGVEVPVLLLMWLKAKYLAVKYRWKRDGNDND